MASPNSDICFTRFPELPAETRQQIWEQALLSTAPSFLYISPLKIVEEEEEDDYDDATREHDDIPIPPPALAHTCYESRWVALRHGRPYRIREEADAARLGTWGVLNWTWFSPAKDIVRHSGRHISRELRNVVERVVGSTTYWRRLDFWQGWPGDGEGLAWEIWRRQFRNLKEAIIQPRIELQDGTDWEPVVYPIKDICPEQVEYMFGQNSRNGSVAFIDIGVDIDTDEYATNSSDNDSNSDSDSDSDSNSNSNSNSNSDSDSDSDSDSNSNSNSNSNSDCDRDHRITAQSLSEKLGQRPWPTGCMADKNASLWALFVIAKELTRRGRSGNPLPYHCPSCWVNIAARPRRSRHYKWFRTLEIGRAIVLSVAPEDVMERVERLAREGLRGTPMTTCRAVLVRVKDDRLGTIYPGPFEPVPRLAQA